MNPRRPVLTPLHSPLELLGNPAPSPHSYIGYPLPVSKSPPNLPNRSRIRTGFSKYVAYPDDAFASRTSWLYLFHTKDYFRCYRDPPARSIPRLERSSEAYETCYPYCIAGNEREGICEAGSVSS
jgi:hypothetical protein